MMDSFPAFPVEKYCLESLEILQTAVDLYQEGKTPFYRVASVQLRLLLCDTTRRHGNIVDISLLPQVFPNITLPPFTPEGRPLENVPEMPLSTWLEQRIPTVKGPAITLRTLIRRVCEQDGGVHVDSKPHAGLAGITNHPEWIIAISRVVLWRILPLF
jgi:hypothetical protein